MDEVIVYRRDSPTFLWNVTDENANPFPFEDSGYTIAKFGLKRNIEDDDADKVLDVSVALDFENSCANLTLAPGSLVEDGEYIAELRLIHSSDPAKQKTIHQFRMIVKQDVL